MEFGIDDKLLKASRAPALMANAAYEILTGDKGSLAGQTLIDETLLRERGHSDFDQQE